MSAQRGGEAQEGQSSESLVGREMATGYHSKATKRLKKRKRRNEEFTRMEPWRRRERELKY